MAFADWVKRSDLAATALSRHQNMREVLQAAYKAGERQGRADAEALAQNAVALAVLLEREACSHTVERLISGDGICADDGVWIHDCADAIRKRSNA